jgi:hypothetical protein
MDRGFTVMGLTVTYMPRQVGTGNADTVQQRARFFGYKRSYLGYCRVYLERGTADAYTQYVTHEEEIRRQLIAVRDRGQPLMTWKRQFLLTPALRLTRDCVLDLPYMRYNFGAEWYSPRAPTSDVAPANEHVIAAYLGTLQLGPDVGNDGRSDPQRHLVATGVPLSNVLERLLSQYRTTPPDESMRYTALLLQLQHLDETQPNATCTIYVMSRAVDPTRTRTRSITESGQFASQLQQGADPPADRGGVRRGTIYPGDRYLPSPDTVQLQLHYLDLERDNVTVASDVPAIAVRINPGLPDDAVIRP